MLIRYWPLSLILPVIVLMHFPDALCGETPQKSQLEAARRQDPTGSGTFHRSGMLREQEAARTRSAQADSAAPSMPVTEPMTSEKPKKKKFFLWRWLFRA